MAQCLRLWVEPVLPTGELGGGRVGGRPATFSSLTAAHRDSSPPCTQTTPGA